MILCSPDTQDYSPYNDFITDCIEDKHPLLKLYINDENNRPLKRYHYDLRPDIQNWVKETGIQVELSISTNFSYQRRLWIFEGFVMVFSNPAEEVLFRMKWL